MILKDQPAHLPGDMLIRLSSKADGTMLDRTTDLHAPATVTNRTAFCKALGLEYSDMVYQNIVYGEGQSYIKIATVDATHTTAYTEAISADALFTKTPGVGLFLPVADCIAAVLYDPTHRYLALLHLGRDSTVAELMKQMIDKFMIEGSSPNDLVVYMGPSAKRETYCMQWFDGADRPSWQPFIDTTERGICLNLPGFNRDICLKAGILPENITISPINTMTASSYFSHSMGDVAGRFAVVAMMH